jgi:hypothetical protein
MIENAKKPKNLRFGIARQFHPDDKFDDLSEYDKDKRFKIINIPYEESKGVCWARNQHNNFMIMKNIHFKLILI